MYISDSDSVIHYHYEPKELAPLGTWRAFLDAWNESCLTPHRCIFISAPRDLCIVCQRHFAQRTNSDAKSY